MLYEALEQCYRFEVENRGGIYTQSVELQRHMKVISDWLAGATEAADKSFGMFLCGRCGNGKTTMLQAIRQMILIIDEARIYSGSQSYPEKGVRFVSAKEIVAISKAYHNPTADNKHLADSYRNLKSIEVLCVDDLGQEAKSMSFFGELITPMIDVLSHRYNERLTTLISSNLSPADIRSHYDERLADRFREMMKVVNFGEAASFRCTG